MGTTATFLYDGDHVWADGDGTGSITNRYLYGDAVDDLLARHRVSDGTAWYLTDQVGSVHAIIDAAGTIVDQIVYDSFGNVLSETNPTSGDRFKFTARELDAETGLYYYRARYYSPTTGFFISEDPIGFGGGDTNLNRYVGNNPLTYSDPFGLTAMVETSITSDSGKRAGSAFVSGTIGYACGYLEAWYNHDPNPALAATKEAVVGASIGAVLGPVIGQMPGMYQLMFGIGAAIQAVTSGEDIAIKGLRGACLVAEFAVGGGFRNIKHAADDLHPPKSLDDWARALQRFLTSESGSLPTDPTKIANPVPRRLARVIETRFANSPMLGAPGASEVFVTGAGVRDIGRIKTSNGLARRLTLVDDGGNLLRGARTVIEFDLPSGIATPVNRANPGFVGRGRTAGNAREFVVPNLNISDLHNVTIRHIP